MKGPMPRPPCDRLWAKVPDMPGDDCWLWTGATAHKGYGYIGIGSVVNGTRRNIHTHRLSYILCRGDIPRGLFVLHSCDTPACVNPSHLFLGTNSDNMQDCSAKGRLRGTAGGVNNRSKTHCKRGHPFNAENTYVSAHGYRYCRLCRRAYDRKRRPPGSQKRDAGGTKQNILPSQAACG